jgi:hypothetical protein
MYTTPGGLSGALQGGLNLGPAGKSGEQKRGAEMPPSKLPAGKRLFLTPGRFLKQVFVDHMFQVVGADGFDDKVNGAKLHGLYR